MKYSRIKTVILWVLIIMLASSVRVFAADFDAESLYNSVFVITSGDSLGSGFAIGTNCVITNAHVIDDPKDIVIKNYSGREFSAKIYDIDKKTDVAILCAKLDSENVPLESTSEYSVGDEVYAIGAPQSMEYTLTKGVISSKERVYDNQTFIQTDAAINSGNSGGPLLEKTGKVIGVNTYKMNDTEGISLVIPMKRIIAYVKKCGIKVRDNGIVKGKIKPKDNKEIPSQKGTEEKNKPQEHAQEHETADSNNVGIWVLSALLALSFVANIVLVIVLVYQKKKNIYKPVDPSERTDFSIDILE